MRNVFKIHVKKLRREEYSEDYDVDGRIILNWIL
jgi:hypothetical protein